jgi:hypothetical protein
MCFVNSDLCHLRHKLIGFITEMKSVYSAVRTGSLNEAVYTPSLKGKESYSASKNTASDQHRSKMIAHVEMFN